MSADQESLWHELLAHPAWKTLMDRLTQRRELAMARLVEISQVSSDPLVAAVGHEITELDRMMRMVPEELESERDSNRVPERAGS